MSKILCIFFVLLCLPVFSVFGQARSAVVYRMPPGIEPADMIRVRGFSGIGSRSVVTTPVFNTSVGRGARSPQEWQYLHLQYEVLIPWIDEMTVQFFVLSMGSDPETGENVFSLFQRNVRYVDIEGGRSGREGQRSADAFLRPAALRRFGRVVAAAAVVTINGQVVAQEQEVDRNAPALPETWWQDDRVIRSDAVTIRDGYLLDRTETPWSIINYDDAEFIR